LPFPQLWPNTLLTGLFDRVLGLDGRLVDAVMAYRREAFSREISARDGSPFLADR